MARISEEASKTAQTVVESTWVERNPFAVIVGLLALLLGIFFIAFTAASYGAVPSYPSLLPPSQYDARILALDTEAIEAAYREHVQRMYSGWMKDDAGQPARAITGVRQAQRAYIASMDALKRRQEEIKGGRQ